MIEVTPEQVVLLLGTLSPDAGYAKTPALIAYELHWDPAVVEPVIEQANSQGYQVLHNERGYYLETPPKPTTAEQEVDRLIEAVRLMATAMPVVGLPYDPRCMLMDRFKAQATRITGLGQMVIAGQNWHILYKSCADERDAGKARIAELEAQRDALLAACEAALVALERCGVCGGEGIVDVGHFTSQGPEVDLCPACGGSGEIQSERFDFIRATIAKVKEGANAATGGADHP